MTTVAELLLEKQRLIERLHQEPGLRERDEIERLLSKIDIALNGLERRAERNQRSPA